MSWTLPNAMDNDCWNADPDANCCVFGGCDDNGDGCEYGPTLSCHYTDIPTEGCGHVD
jgi:hypothetical protein